MDNKEYLNIGEAAEFMRMSKSTIYKLSARRELPITKIGNGRVIISKKALLKYLEDRQVGGERGHSVDGKARGGRL